VIIFNKRNELCIYFLVEYELHILLNNFFLFIEE